MKGRMRRLFFFFIIIFASASTIGLSAQELEADNLVRSAGLMHAKYDFDKACEMYDRAISILEDSSRVSYDSLKILSVRDRLLLSENGRNMSSFVYSPIVEARHKFSLEDFFLYYPLQDRSWRPVPNQLDSASVCGLTRAVYVPEETGRIYYSAEDEDGIRNIYMTELLDTVWTCPSLLNEHMISSSDEIYPLLSSDGRTMYFASKGLYGIGGFDIYMSEWSDEENDWSVPVNMGFPYSSPADDFLFMNTDDGKHTIFASNRDCSSDSVWVYVLEFDNMPVRRAVENPEELVELSHLVPTDASETLEGTDVSTSMPEHADTRRYMDKMVEVRALRDSLSFYTSSLDDESLRYESRIPQLQDSLDRAVARLQDIEMEFFLRGVVIDPDKMMAEADREVVGEATSYAFTKMNWGDTLRMDIMEPEKKFDYTFMVLEKGQFAEDNTIPPGIIYQIQMYSSSRKATIENLKGLSPVFERRNASGKYIYRVGLFNTYNDVLSKLNAVKKAGFRSAFIAAYIDGKEVSVSKARTEEKNKPAVKTHYRIEMVAEDGTPAPEILNGIRQQSGEKDMARSENSDGSVTYTVGPFDDKAKADAIMDFIKAMGINKVLCVPVVNDSVNQ